MTKVGTKFKVISSLFWKFMERIGTQGVQLIVQIILARLLVPEDFGVIALITIFISISNVIVQSGWGKALIQKKNPDEIDFSSTFYLSLFIAFLMYILLFMLSPCIASFYKNASLVKIIRIQSLVLFFGAVNTIQNAIVAKNFEFKKLFISSVAGILISGFVGVVFAYLGYGVWALVFQQLTNYLIVTLVLWFTVKWRPLLKFSFERVKALFSFGGKLLVSGLLDTIYQNIYSLVIGKIYNVNILGYYNRGEQFPKIIVTNIDESIQSVLFPTLSENQENIERVKMIVKRTLTTSSFIIFPMIIGLIVVAKPLIIVLLTETWLPSVVFLQLLAFSYITWPINTASLQAINALGRSDIFLKLEIIKKVIGTILLCICIPFGIYVMVYSQIINSFICTLINTYPNRKLINYKYAEIWRDIKPIVFLSVCMGLLIYPIVYLGFPSIVTLIIQVFSGIIIYVGLAYFFKMDCFMYILHTLLEIKNSNLNKNEEAI